MSRPPRLFLGSPGFLVAVVLSAACRAPVFAPQATLAELERRVEAEAVARERLDAFRAARPGVVPSTPAELATVANRWLATLGTSHTELLTLEDPRAFELADVFWEALPRTERERVFGAHGPRLAGIGVRLAQDERGPFVRAVLDGSPAARAGLAVGERILAVEGEPFAPVGSFRARAGRATELRVEAPDGTRRTLVLVPDELAPGARFLAALRASAHVRTLDGRALAYVHLWSWAGAEPQEALAELLLRGALAEADGLVLDLRDGLGGANPDALALFAREVPTLTWSAADGAHGRIESAWKKPVVLLVDGTTTSGKEVFARAFQRAGRGPVVGTRTAGAVAGGSLFLLPGACLLYLAVREMLVEGERLEGRGVQPDVPVEWERARGGPDRPLERAFEVLRDELARAGSG